MIHFEWSQGQSSYKFHITCSTISCAEYSFSLEAASGIQSGKNVRIRLELNLNLPVIELLNLC